MKDEALQTVIRIPPKDLFGNTFSCACGRTHRILPKEVIYAENVMDRLPMLLQGLKLGSEVGLLMDRRTQAVAGDEVERVLRRQGYQVKSILIKDPPGGKPQCDDRTKEEIEGHLGPVDWIFPVGSGVINDLGKWIAGDRGIPFVTFATAASMNGYASANVAPTIAGMKSLTFARPPILIMSSPSVLISAPYEMTTAGLGDVLAKGISTADWYMNHFLFGDYFCEKSATLISDIEPLYLNHSNWLRAGDPESMEALFFALILTGVAMTMAGTSAPASGAEHMISHCLDMMASIDGGGHDLHGRQVGVGTLLMADLYRRCLALESPVFVDPPHCVDTGFWGPLANAVADNFQQKGEGLQRARDVLSKGEMWDRFREGLSSMVPVPETIYGCLLRADGAVKAKDIGCTKGRLLEAVLHSHEIRPRITMLDIAHLVGLMPDVADEILECWA